MLDRMIGAACLDVKTFEEVENDRSTTGQAFLVVIIVSFAAAVSEIFATGSPLIGIINGVVQGVVIWLLMALIIFLIGTRLFNTPTTSAKWGQVARTMAFARSPGILLIFGFVPLFGDVIRIIVFFWTLWASVIGVRQALDYRSTARAVIVVLLATLLAVIPLLFLPMLGLDVGLGIRGIPDLFLGPVFIVLMGTS